MKRENISLDDFTIRKCIEEYEDELRYKVKGIPNIRIYNPSPKPSKRLGLTS